MRISMIRTLALLAMILSSLAAMVTLSFPATATEKTVASRPFDGWARTSHYGPLVHGDSLAKVAARLRIDHRYTLAQVMVALFDKNRDKFIHHNINLIQAGVTLVVPSAAEVERTAPDQASLFIAKQQIPFQIKDLRIDSVRLSPIRGLYEVQSGHNVFYSNASGTHLIAGGHIFDTRTKEDLTEARLEQINRINWSVLPLDKAIVSGDPNGMAIAIFTDPDCPFCRRLEQELQHAKGIKVYTFMYPLTRIHPHARQHAESIWCAKNRHKAMLDVMLNNANPPKAHCNTKTLDDIQALGEKLGIHGTPTMIARDGRMFAGYMPLDRLEAWLANSKTTHH